MATIRPRKFYYFAGLSLLFIAVLAFSAFAVVVIMRRMRKPDFYKPNGQIAIISPIQHKQVGTVIPREPGVRALLPGAKWVPQTFNNCGPATTSMVLQYFGFTVTQEETKSHLRTNSDDKNVFTYEIADYLRNNYGIESRLMFGGDITMLKRLITNGFYVVVEDWLHPNEDIGHVTIIRGFDDEQGVLIADDSYIGVGVTYPYEQFRTTQWKAFNYEYLPLYTPGNEDLLQAIIGENWDETIMYTNAANTARSEIAENDNDMYAWFNLGTNLFALGDYSGAKQAFERSRAIGWPKRMLWYQIQPIQVYNRLGQYDKAIEYADIALWSNDSFAEAHLEKAIAYKGQENTEKAREEVMRALHFSPDFIKAKEFLAAL